MNCETPKALKSGRPEGTLTERKSRIEDIDMEELWQKEVGNKRCSRATNVGGTQKGSNVSTAVL